MSSLTYVPDAVTLGLGLLVARLVVGVLLAGHGAQKLLGWFRGPGIAGTAGYFETLGFRPARPFVVAAALSEVASGLLITLGALGPVGPALALSVMIVAAVSVHWKNGVFATANGIELALLYAAAAVGLGFTGPGVFSLDQALGILRAWTPGLDAAVLALGALGGAVALLSRRPARHGRGVAPGLRANSATTNG